MRAALRSGHGMRLWEECEAADGTPYWYNTQTAESVWDRPEDLEAVVPHDGGASRPGTGEPGGGGARGSRASRVSRTSRTSADGLTTGGGGDAVVWEVCEGDDGRMYYYNTSTGESQWEEPREVAEARARGDEIGSLASGGSRPSTSGGLQQPDGPLPKAWEECVDDDGKTFYYNETTGVSTWERPDPDDDDDDDDNDEIEEEAGDMIGGRWEVVVDEESGRKYFYNGETGESVWERPADETRASAAPTAVDDGSFTLAADLDGDEADGSWEQVTDEEGFTYYYNKATGESSWERPP
jgi:hypothetical protein